MTLGGQSFTPKHTAAHRTSLAVPEVFRDLPTRLGNRFASQGLVGCRITFYNHQRPHTANGGQPPAAAMVYLNAIKTNLQL
jgi:hypothetical protein